LTPLLQSLGVAVPNPLASGHVVCQKSGKNSLLRIDPDGAAGKRGKRALVWVRNVTCGALSSPPNFLF
jgi:hypothetical protein